MKFAIVTGASRGLGQALVCALLADDWTVAGLARSAMNDFANKSFQACQVDLTDADAAASTLEKLLTTEVLGEASEICLINNAGVVTPVALCGNLPHASISTALSLNLITPIALVNAFLRLTANSSARRSVANISSGAAQSAYPGWSVYCASKAGLDHFTRCVASEQAVTQAPLRIASIAPGIIDTDMQAQLRAVGENDFPARQRFVELHAGGLLTSPEIVAAQLLSYLASTTFGNPPVVDLRTL